MAWTAPLTAVAGAALTAAQWNAQIRDNLAETLPGKAMTVGSYLLGDGANAVRERAVSGTTGTFGDTTSTTWISLGVSAVADAAAGAYVRVFFGGQVRNTVNLATHYIGVGIDGAAPTGPGEIQVLQWGNFDANNSNRAAGVATLSSPNANATYTLWGRISSGTCTFSALEIVIVP